MNNLYQNQMAKSSALLFMIGLFSETQLHFIGSIGISEIPIFIFAPFLFIRNYRCLKNDGFLTFVWLAIAVCIGCIVSGIYNSTPFLLIVKGFATPYAIFAVTVVLHNLLRKNPKGVSWLFIGSFLSMIISVFVFQPETYTYAAGGVATGAEAIEKVISFPLFWARRFSYFFSLPIRCAYLSVPLAYSVSVTVLCGCATIYLSGSSGRAAALVALVGAAILLIGGRTQSRISKLRKHLPIALVLLVVVALLGKYSYSIAAKSGYLGDEAAQKYERQTSRGESAINILMAGRKEFFIGMKAALDRPIIGHGPAAEDRKGYTIDFLSKYGTDEDYKEAIRFQISAMQEGYRYFIIPTHSFVASFWVYYGIAGLIIWVYCLWLIWMYFRRYAAAIPQWFGYLGIFLPTIAWGIFFSPFGDRIGCTLPFICILLCRAVYMNRLDLPMGMRSEIMRSR